MLWSMPPDFPSRPTLPRVLFADEFGYAALRPLVASGEIVRVREGAYFTPSNAADTWEREMEVALAHAVGTLGCDHVLSHQTAALVHGCWVGRLDGDTHITQRTKPRDNDVLGLRRHVAQWEEADVVAIEGLPVTSLERTIEDCARFLTPREGLLVADSGLRVLARPDRFDRVASEIRLEEHRRLIQGRLVPKKGWRGIARGRAVLAAADGFAESAGESRLRWVALSRGLPRPVCQFPVETERGQFFLDFAWPQKEGGQEFPDGARVLGEEYDGRAKYGDEIAGTTGRPNQALFEEKLREDALRTTGVRLRRRVAEDLHDPDRVADDMRRRFPSAAAAPSSPFEVFSSSYCPAKLPQWGGLRREAWRDSDEGRIESGHDLPTRPPGSPARGTRPAEGPAPRRFRRGGRPRAGAADRRGRPPAGGDRAA